MSGQAQKRLLMLGGADIQISAIEDAKRHGYYVITCDYLPDNPGHAFSDEYHDVSTTDKEAVLKLARSLNIDGISSYASDPGAMTAAYVAEKLGLPGNSFKTVDLISDKLKFRQVQLELGLPHPAFAKVRSADEINQFLSGSVEECIIKPVDSSGSKGIFRIKPGQATQEIYESSLADSRQGDVIAEEFIERKGFFMTGDVFVENGRIIFSCFGDVHFNNRLTGLVPIGVSLPASLPPDFFDGVVEQLQSIFDHTGVTMGAFNVDVLQTQDGTPVIIDIGARNGGNMLNNIYELRTGYPLITNSIKQCLDEPLLNPELSRPAGFYSHYVIHSLNDGTVRDITFSDFIKQRIIYQKLNIKVGEEVHRFLNTRYRMGLLLLKYNSFEEMHDLIPNMYDHLRFELENVNPEAG